MMKRILPGLIPLLLVGFLVSCEKESDAEKEEAAIEAYLLENNITISPTYSGLYYIETFKGKGAAADGGDKVSVRYRGTFLDGEEFDSGVYTFTIGRGEVIRGWDEGISYMNEGGKAILLIPSSLGYGPYGSGDIPGYTPLLFEVELMDVY
jgi:FKBP-type peptidyl-prolyl cis-trans isomerase